MIEGRKTKTVYAIFADDAFIHAHHEEIKRASGFVSISGKEYDIKPLKQKVTALNFASPYEAVAFADEHGDNIWVDSGTMEPSAITLDKEVPVFSDWYSNDEFRKWWKTKPDRKLDVVRLSFDDFEKMNVAYDEAMKKKCVSVDSVLSALPLTRFCVRISDYMTIEYAYSDMELKADIFRVPDEYGREYRVGSLICHGLEEGKELEDTIVALDPFFPSDIVDDLAYKAAWTFVIVNWFVKSLPAYVRKQSRKVKPKQKPSKKKAKQKPLEVVWRDEYEVDLKEVTRQTLRHEIKCLCWGVRGHVRHYKDGREIFIKPYRKGKERDNPDAYVAKTYRKETDD